jgi:hypothetical protein
MKTDMISDCCHAAVTIDLLSDPCNFSDDEYDLKIPFRVCSNCGCILEAGHIDFCKERPSEGVYS